jgi:hypothetical protein
MTSCTVMKPPSNKRRETRLRAPGLIANLKLQAKTITCEVGDISRGGMFLLTDRVVAVGTKVMVELVPAERDVVIPLAGEIVSLSLKDRKTAPPGLRIRFARPTGPVAIMFERLLRSFGGPPRPGAAMEPPNPRVIELEPVAPPRPQVTRVMKIQGEEVTDVPTRRSRLQRQLGELEARLAEREKDVRQLRAEIQALRAMLQT